MWPFGEVFFDLFFSFFDFLCFFPGPPPGKVKKAFFLRAIPMPFCYKLRLVYKKGGVFWPPPLKKWLFDLLSSKNSVFERPFLNINRFGFGAMKWSNRSSVFSSPKWCFWPQKRGSKSPKKVPKKSLFKSWWLSQSGNKVDGNHLFLYYRWVLVKKSQFFFVNHPQNGLLDPQKATKKGTFCHFFTKKWTLDSHSMAHFKGFAFTLKAKGYPRKGDLFCLRSSYLWLFVTFHDFFIILALFAPKKRVKMTSFSLFLTFCVFSPDPPREK